MVFIIAADATKKRAVKGIGIEEIAIALEENEKEGAKGERKEEEEKRYEMKKETTVSNTDFFSIKKERDLGLN